MRWCLTTLTITAALMGLAVLRMPARRLTGRPSIAGLLRGCAAVVCLLAALALAGLGMLVDQ
jgi:hypothetical protein